MTIDHTAPLAAAAAILADEALAPPPADDGPPGGLAWLRHRVARFSSGEDHRRRRALAAEPLAASDVERLRRTARERTAAVLAAAAGPVDVMAVIARDVPVSVLAEALGAPGIDVAAVRAVAAAYPTGEGGPAADRAVAALVDAFGGGLDEATAAAVGLLVQTCEATAGLIGNALIARRGDGTGALIETTLRTRPPVRATVRRAAAATEPAGMPMAAGDHVRVRLSDDGGALPFGAGPHACPGRHQAAALAAGVCDALQDKRVLRYDRACDLSANLDVPILLEVLPR